MGGRGRGESESKKADMGDVKAKDGESKGQFTEGMVVVLLDLRKNKLV